MNKQQVWLFKTVLHLSCAIPLVFLWQQVQSGAAGGDPVQYVIHFLGMGALHTLLLTLVISPLSRVLKQPVLMKVRRLLGLWCFAYALLHLLAFLTFDLLFDWPLLLGEIIKRPYISVGMAAFVILLLLALTSPQYMQRFMGRRWQKLHNGVYLVALLVPLHFWWSVKSGVWEPALYSLALIGLLAVRIFKKTHAQKRAAQKSALKARHEQHRSNHKSPQSIVR